MSQTQFACKTLSEKWMSFLLRMAGEMVDTFLLKRSKGGLLVWSLWKRWRQGSVSWGSAGSPPTSASPWGNSAQSSPPVSSGAWAGAPPRPSTAGSSGSGTASVPGTISTGAPWGGHPPRPSSAGSGIRP
ncbi:unnamed protein product [Calypogeia fissa]